MVFKNTDRFFRVVCSTMSLHLHEALCCLLCLPGVQVDLDDPVPAELAPIPGGVAEEDHMGRAEGNLAALVLLHHVETILQGLRHRVEVGAVLRSSPGDVEDCNLRPVVAVRQLHIRLLARERNCSMVPDEVDGEPALALSPHSVSDPDDVAVVRISCEEIEEVLLPLPRLEVYVRLHIVLQCCFECCDTPVEPHEHARHFCRYFLSGLA